jgi:hypothetical protein
LKTRDTHRALGLRLLAEDDRVPHPSTVSSWMGGIPRTTTGVPSAADIGGNWCLFSELRATRPNMVSERI